STATGMPRKTANMATAHGMRVHLFPRRKAGDETFPEKGRRPVEVDLRMIQGLFGVPQPDAAAALGVSLTALKQVCRKLGIPRWPYQRPSKQAKHGKRHRASAAVRPAAGVVVEHAWPSQLSFVGATPVIDADRVCVAEHCADYEDCVSDSGDSYTSAVTVDTQRVAGNREGERCEDEAGECTRTCSAVSMASTAAPSAHYRGMARGPSTSHDLAPCAAVCAAAARAPARDVRSIDAADDTADDHDLGWLISGDADESSAMGLLEESWMFEMMCRDRCQVLGSYQPALPQYNLGF
ncbi:MAG: RWP-RK domain-containing protein, partial [Promethearchaeia archaeon]